MAAWLSGHIWGSDKPFDAVLSEQLSSLYSIHPLSAHLTGHVSRCNLL
jgi:hypothetical protein